MTIQSRKQLLDDTLKTYKTNKNFRKIKSFQRLISKCKNIKENILHIA